MKKDRFPKQLQFEIDRKYQEDRNFAQGGRSFYFFDFDDNIAFLSTFIYLFHTENGREISLSSGEFARNQHLIGKHGELRNFEIRWDEKSGSFRNFRDVEQGFLSRVLRRKQRFVRDVLDALQTDDHHWKGPSWDCFYHAVFNQRPLSIVTARGHSPNTIVEGIWQWVRYGHLPGQPNFLNIIPVSHEPTRDQLLSSTGLSWEEMKAQPDGIAKLKKMAISASVDRAFEAYGQNDFHRFGMSDDDPKNVQLILEAMVDLKGRFPENSFFVFDSSHGQLVRHEVLTDSIREQKIDSSEQISLL